jgi:release factor glutamine methyltransferase
MEIVPRRILLIFTVLLLLSPSSSSHSSFSLASAAKTTMQTRSRQTLVAFSWLPPHRRHCCRPPRNVATLNAAAANTAPTVSFRAMMMARHRRGTINSFWQHIDPSSLSLFASSSSLGPLSSSSSLQRLVTTRRAAFGTALNGKARRSQEQELQQGTSDDDGQSQYRGDDMNDENEKTVLQVMQSSIETLKLAQIDEPEESVYHLLAFSLNLSWETGFRDLRQLYLQHSSALDNVLSQRLLTRDELHAFSNLLHRRLLHEPIQYLVGQWDFLNHVFTIQPPLLCPRPETEELVLLALQDLQAMLRQRKQQRQEEQQQQHEPLRILDVGCGTGCIGISLLAAALTPASTLAASPHPAAACQVVALDVEERAITVSTLNAQRILGNTISSNCYQAILSSAADYDVDVEKHHGFDLIISNPPYIPQADMETLDATVLHYESHEALFGGGADGMNVIRDIVRQLPQWCRRRGGREAICWMEVDPTQPPLLQEWLIASSPSLPVEYVKTAKDLQGKDRFVKFRVKFLPENEDSSTMS